MVYSDNFDSCPVGSVLTPLNWSQFWSNGAWSMANGNFLQCITTGSNAWRGIGPLDVYTDVTVQCKAMFSAQANSHLKSFIIARASINSSLLSGYMLALTSTSASSSASSLALARFDNDALTELGTYGISVPYNKWVWLKLSVVGSSIKGKYWDIGGTEPAWQIELTDSAHSSGRCGVGARNLLTTFSFANFSITQEFAQVSIGSNLTVSGNGAGDFVAIIDATTKGLVKLVEPDINGDWAASVPEGEYYALYFGAGCQPIAHGPYTLTAT